jgi:hypothetical protein
MPFAKKFQAMVEFPFEGDVVDGFTIESVDVRDVQGGAAGYVYGVNMVLQGVGGQQGVRKALKKLINSHPMTFSGYGNPYQLWFRKSTMNIESLGDRRYAVQIEGSGCRIYIGEELNRFLAHLEKTGVAVPQEDQLAREVLVETYLDGYKTEIARKVGRYYGKLRRKKVKSNE